MATVIKLQFTYVYISFLPNKTDVTLQYGFICLQALSIQFHIQLFSNKLRKPTSGRLWKQTQEKLTRPYYANKRNKTHFQNN